MVIVHAGLVLRRLGEFGEPGTAIAQEVVDRVFTGFDDALREMSISDVGVAKRMKSMAEAFYGRSAVYNAALAALNAEALAVALQRNVYRAGAKARGHAGICARSPRASSNSPRRSKAIPLKAFEEKGFRFPRPEGCNERAKRYSAVPSTSRRCRATA